MDPGFVPDDGSYSDTLLFEMGFVYLTHHDQINEELTRRLVRNWRPFLERVAPLADPSDITVCCILSAMGWDWDRNSVSEGYDHRGDEDCDSGVDSNSNGDGDDGNNGDNADGDVDASGNDAVNGEIYDSCTALCHRHLAYSRSPKF